MNKSIFSLLILFTTLRCYSQNSPTAVKKGRIVNGASQSPIIDATAKMPAAGITQALRWPTYSAV